MSVTVNNTSINYGSTSTITVNDLINVTITPSNSVINTEYTDTSIIYIVKPNISTLYYIIGYNGFNQQINLNTTVYVNVTLLNNILNITYNNSQEINVYGCVSYSWTPSLYLNNNNTSSVICTPLENITYTIIGKDSFNTISRTYLEIIVNTDLVFTPSNPTIYDGNLLILSVNYIGNYNFNNELVSYSNNDFNNDFNNEHVSYSNINSNNDFNYDLMSYSNNDLVSNNDFNNDFNNDLLSNNDSKNNMNYVWKSTLFNTLPPNCVYYKYGNTIKLHPYNTQEYKVTLYDNNNIVTSGNIKINVIEKPSNIIDIDILPYILYKPVLDRDKKKVVKILKEDKTLSYKIINFYYTTLQTAYRMEFTNKSGISFSIKWITLYQIINKSNEMILNFRQQWKFFQYINYNQRRGNVTVSNFAYLLNCINEIYLEYPQKIGIYPL
jgi:hypothetical protein